MNQDDAVALAASLHPTIMDARLLLNWHPNDIYQASVMTLDVARCWSKVYRSKRECLTEPCLLGLLTLTDEEDVLSSDFDVKDRILVFRVDTEPEVLAEAQFNEIMPAKLN